MIASLLPPERTTVDGDVMVYAPVRDAPAVELAADEVAPELGLTRNWLNSDAQIRRDTLPDGWQQRRIYVGTYGRLHVYAASRVDLIAMKVLAGRPQDVEDLQQMKVEGHEADFVRRQLATMKDEGTDPQQIEEAYELLSILERLWPSTIL
jgi:hypothetical protein